MFLYNRNHLPILAVTLCFFILRMAIPFTLYALIISLIISYIVSFSNIKIFIKEFESKRVKIFIPFILTILSFSFALIFDHTKQFILYKEFINIPLIISILFLFIVNIKDKIILEKFTVYFTKYYLILIAFICFLALIKFWLLLKGIHLSLLVNHDKYPWGFSLSTDYNFYAVAIFIGFLLLFWRGENLFINKFSILENIFFAVICINVFYSGSRRGIIILFSILLIQFSISFYKYFFKNINDKVLWKSIIGVLVILMQIYFLFYANFPIRKYSGKAIGVYALTYKKEITAISFRYITLIDPKADYKKMYSDMWPKEDENKNIIEEEVKEPIYEKTTYGSRIERWKYGSSLFFEQYNIIQKFVGNGFNYLNLYAIRFKVILFNSYDYPHNPLIASLLYNGIIGFTILSFYLFYSLLIIIKLKLYNNIFINSYVIISFFSLLSGNSYFSIPIYVAITLVPYYIYYIYQLSENNSISK